jgi:hypothetical protein
MELVNDHFLQRNEGTVLIPPGKSGVIYYLGRPMNALGLKKRGWVRQIAAAVQSIKIKSAGRDFINCSAAIAGIVPLERNGLFPGKNDS